MSYTFNSCYFQSWCFSLQKRLSASARPPASASAGERFVQTQQQAVFFFARVRLLGTARTDLGACERFPSRGWEVGRSGGKSSRGPCSFSNGNPGLHVTAVCYFGD